MEADISIWHKTGHFYFALTGRELHSVAQSARAFSAASSGSTDVEVRILFPCELGYFFCSNRGLEQPPSGGLQGP